jgi:hypothetical protein
MTKVLLGTRQTEQGEQVTDRLSMEVSHYNGLYRLCVTNETVERGFVQFLIFARGNFNYTITTGRKSQKKLDTLNQIIEDNKDKLNSLWLEDKFQDMCQLVHEQAVLKKVA